MPNLDLAHLEEYLRNKRKDYHKLSNCELNKEIDRLKEQSYKASALSQIAKDLLWVRSVNKG